MMAKTLGRLAGVAASKPAVTLGIVLALALGGGVLALRLKPNTNSDTFVSRSSPTFQASLDDNKHFGGDPVVILIREPLTDLVETKDLATVSQLEACLAGQVVVANQQLQAFTPAPAGSATPYGGWGSPCGKLMKARPAQVVYGPGTFLNRAVAAVNTEISQITERGAADGPDRQDERVQARARAAHVEEAGDHARERRGLDRPRAGDHEPAPDVPELRHLGPADDRRSAVHPGDRVRPDPRREPAEVTVCLPVPDRRLGADPGPAEGVAELGRSRPRRSSGSSRRCGCRCSAPRITARTRSRECRSSPTPSPRRSPARSPACSPARWW